MMKLISKSKIRCLAVLALMAVCGRSADAQPWVPLFNGYSLDGWTDGNGNKVQEGGWSVEEGGVLHLNRANGRGGNLLSEKEYEDFELVFEWKISRGGNNGIKYRVNDFDGRLLGCEYQIIDDFHNRLTPKHKTAALYDVYEVADHHVLKPDGEWNRGRIVVTGNTIEHWLNGHLVMTAVVGSDDWNHRIQQSKFRDVPGFGETRRGRIMLTDHRDEVWYRNIFIRDLSTAMVARSTCQVAPRTCRRVARRAGIWRRQRCRCYSCP